MSLNIGVDITTIGGAAVLREVLVERGRQARRPGRGHRLRRDRGRRRRRGRRRGRANHAQRARIAAAAQRDHRGGGGHCAVLRRRLPGRSGHVAAIERHFDAHPRTVVATGLVLADGINGPGLSSEEGRAILRRPAAEGVVAAVFTGRGCNMAVRLAPKRAHRLHFDERLPLYPWQEDVDLSRCLAPYGDIVKLTAARGVHFGVRVGRGKSVRLGYSQVANPFSLCGKRRGYPLARALGRIAAAMAMNVAKSVTLEPRVDRRGRLFGAMLAIRDLAFGRMAPERILQL